MIRTVEGSLQRVQANIHELERKVKMADGKAQAHYQEQLKELKSNWETLQDKLFSMREEGEAGTPKPVMPSHQPPQSRTGCSC